MGCGRMGSPATLVLKTRRRSPDRHADQGGLPRVGRAAQVSDGNQNTNVPSSAVGRATPTCATQGGARALLHRARGCLDAARLHHRHGTAATLFGAEPDRQADPHRREQLPGGRGDGRKGSQGWFNPDDQIYIPYTTAMRRVAHRLAAHDHRSGDGHLARQPGHGADHAGAAPPPSPGAGPRN